MDQISFCVFSFTVCYIRNSMNVQIHFFSNASKASSWPVFVSQMKNACHSFFSFGTLFFSVLCLSLSVSLFYSCNFIFSLIHQSISMLHCLVRETQALSLFFSFWIKYISFCLFFSSYIVSSTWYIKRN